LKWEPGYNGRSSARTFQTTRTAHHPSHHARHPTTNKDDREKKETEGWDDLDNGYDNGYDLAHVKATSCSKYGKLLSPFRNLLSPPSDGCRLTVLKCSQERGVLKTPITDSIMLRLFRLIFGF